MNGMNLVDGLDGLAGGVATASGCALAALLHDDARLQAEALALGCVGFLTLNRPPASVYLGDGGAYLIGTSLALLLASAWQRGSCNADESRQSVGSGAAGGRNHLRVFVRRRKGSQSVTEGDRGNPLRPPCRPGMVHSGRRREPVRRDRSGARAARGRGCQEEVDCGAARGSRRSCCRDGWYGKGGRSARSQVGAINISASAQTNDQTNE